MNICECGHEKEMHDSLDCTYGDCMCPIYRPKAEPPKRVAIPCPDGIEGCAVAHYRIVEPKASPSLEDAAVTNIIEEIKALLDGIDRCEQGRNPADWWEISTQAQFGASKLAELLEVVAKFARQQRREAVAEFVAMLFEGLTESYVTVDEIQAVAKEMLDPSATLSPDARDQDIQAVQSSSQELPVRPDDEAGEVHP